MDTDCYNTNCIFRKDPSEYPYPVSPNYCPCTHACSNYMSKPVSIGFNHTTTRTSQQPSLITDSFSIWRV